MILTRPPKVIVIQKEIFFYYGNAGNDILTSAHICITCTSACNGENKFLPLSFCFHKNWNVLNAPHDTLSSGVAACQLVLNFLERATIQHIWQKYQHTFSSQQILFDYPSFDKHFSLSRQEQSIFTYQSIIGIRNFAGEFGTHVNDSFLDGIYQNFSF